MRVAVAGTFGPVHDGHRALFETALEVGDEGVIVGLTSDEFARSSRTRPVPSFEERLSSLTEEFASLDRWSRHIEFRRIHDEFGFADDDPTLDALVVSPETVEEVQGINDTRREHGMDPLVAVVAPYTYAEDGERISSTRIVEGEIDEHGNVVR